MKVWVQFLLCVLFSASIWLVLNLSQNYVAIVSVPMTARSNIEGRAALSQSEATVTAQVSASGYRHVVMARRHKRTGQVSFAASDFRHTEGDRYAISNTALYRYVSQIFGEGATVESFISEDPEFSFPEETYKKVPVRAVLAVEYAPQYMALKPLQVQPDSVLAYGPADLLANIESVKTASIVRSDVKGSLHGEIALDAPEGIRLSDNTVSWAVEVSRYVELEAELPVVGRNVPAGSVFSIYPSKARVVFRCVFPVIFDPSSTAVCYVDYKEFAGSLTGRCIIHCDNLPGGVISWSAQPEVAECVEKL